MNSTTVDRITMPAPVRNNPQAREVVETVLARLVACLRPRRVILYGSYAHGQPRADSDLDFLVVTDSSAPAYEQHEQARAAVGDTAMPIDVFVLSSDEFDETRGVIGGLAYVPAKYGVELYAQPCRPRSAQSTIGNRQS
jgi:predicted nucleotidyltransferase